MKNLKIAILANQFINWGGGIDYIRLIINGLDTLRKRNNIDIEIIVYVPQKSNNLIRIKNYFKYLINIAKKNKLPISPVIKQEYIIKAFESFPIKNQIIFYRKEERKLYSSFQKKSIDVILPTFNPFPIDFPIKWIGYIYDFQHKYFPDFFTSSEIERRDKHFQSIVDQAKVIFVNSNSVKKDISKFLVVRGPIKIVTLPFCPYYDENFFKSEVDISSYKLPSKYFLISNQFWKHKDHITAITAFKHFLENEAQDDFGLVCTGQTQDERFPNYFDEIKNKISELDIKDKVYILGYIKKNEQLQILKNAVAVIQPTLFEGGPGGGAVYESVAYGIRSIVSDIPVNLEISDETITFFQHSNPFDLSIKMGILSKSKSPKFSNEILLNRNNIRLADMGEQLLNAIV